MIPDHSLQIKAMLRSGKMINIGERRVIVPEPSKRANSRDRSDAIKLALAFVAIYVAGILGWLLAREPLTLRVVLASVAILGAMGLIRRGERAGAARLPQTLPWGG